MGNNTRITYQTYMEYSTHVNKYSIMNIGKALEEELDNILFTKIRCQVLLGRTVTNIKLSDELIKNVVDKINRVVTRETTIRYEYI